MSSSMIGPAGSVNLRPGLVVLALEVEDTGGVIRGLNRFQLPQHARQDVGILNGNLSIEVNFTSEEVSSLPFAKVRPGF